MDNVRYIVKCKLYEDTDKGFKFNVFLNETGVIAFSHGLIVLEVTYDKITKEHFIKVYHCEDKNLLTNAEVVGVIGPAIDGYIKYLLSGKRKAVEYYRDYIEDVEDYFISWINARIESINNDTDNSSDMIN